MSNVIDIRSRLKEEKTQKKSKKEEAPIVDIGQARAELIKEDRRQLRRTMLTEFISLHSIVPGFGLLKVALNDINDKGLAFDLEEGRGEYSVGDSVELRIYLNHQTYFPIHSKVVYVNRVEGVVRHGCEFIHDSINSDALKHFVAFLESVTAAFRRDQGDVLVSKINS